LANEALGPLGPIFGPNFLVVTVNDDQTGRQFELEIYPDANNPQLKANHMRTHYYFVPRRVYLAKKETAPADFDFAMTIFKGLMTSETTLGIADRPVTEGSGEIGGGICTFSTTFAIPESVIQGVKNQLKSRDAIPASSWNVRDGSRLQQFQSNFNFEQNDLDPEVGIVTIVENNVTVEVPALSGIDGHLPFFINAQGSGKGSIEAAGISSFLVTCNQFAAGVIGGNLKNGHSPFTVHYNLKQQFYINECQATVKVDVDKAFDQFSAAVSASQFLGVTSASLAEGYTNCITHGGIETIINMNNAVLANDDPLKKLIDTQVEEMKKQALDLVKSEIFDWKPTEQPAASGDKGFFSKLFGNSSVSIKSNYQRRSLQYQSTFTLNGSIAIYDTKSGDLNDLEPAITAPGGLAKYFSVVDIGSIAQKLQVAAKENVNWSERLPDGTNLSDPIQSVQVEVGYPDYSQPLGSDGNPSPHYRAEGLHYTLGHKDPNHGNELAIWTKDNPADIIDINFLKLDQPVPGWDAEEVMYRKTISYDPEDPRVELSGNRTAFVSEVRTTSHAPTITPDEVGYVFVKFMLDRPLPNDAISMTLTCAIADRKDTLTITKSNQKNLIWEIFSDKYFNETSFTYDLQVEVVGPNFTDPPVEWGTPTPVKQDFPTGRIKYISPLKLPLPPIPPDKVDLINSYVKAGNQ
jgi:hypothetical protein